MSNGFIREQQGIVAGESNLSLIRPRRRKANCLEEAQPRLANLALRPGVFHAPVEQRFHFGDLHAQGPRFAAALSGHTGVHKLLR